MTTLNMQGNGNVCSFSVIIYFFKILERTHRLLFSKLPHWKSTHPTHSLHARIPIEIITLYDRLIAQYEQQVRALFF
jgi:hypothetical protein